MFILHFPGNIAGITAMRRAARKSYCINNRADADPRRERATESLRTKNYEL